MIDLRKYFDRVVVLTLVEEKERQEFIKDEFSQLGLTGWEFHYECMHPFQEDIIGALNYTKHGQFTKPNEYGCARSHYSIIKQALLQECKNILIFEDDACLLQNMSVFLDFLDNMPKEYDLLQFGGFTGQLGFDDFLKEHKDEKWIKHYGWPVWCASMYALSRKGMAVYLMMQDHKISVSDMPIYMLNKPPLFYDKEKKQSKIPNTFISTIPLHIQQNKKFCKSTIRDENNDDIDYENENLYETNINKADYFGYKMQ